MEGGDWNRKGDRTGYPSVTFCHVENLFLFRSFWEGEEGTLWSLASGDLPLQVHGMLPDGPLVT